jgi:SAM-dependent methyltransferase
MTRWFADLAGTEIFGCDYNGELVGWCQTNLPFMRATTSNLEPPLPYDDESFDLVYAYSVFTHLSVGLAGHWIEELRRIVKPGGHLWFTLHGESYRARLHPADRARFDAGEIVVWLPEIEGTNLCASYWPEASVKTMLGSGFEVCSHLDPKTDPTAADAAWLEHDAYLVRRI